jgi:uncharacterized protein YyaL (SSP411 family)
MYRILFLLLLIGCSTRSGQQNQLSNSQSPYLREHADNPVNWQEWNDATLEQARAEDKPLLVSIGYSACHWCHVMENESFMNEEVARIMNENFVCVKVDREERSDVDQMYIHAAEVMTVNAGWPLNAFALPDGRAFHIATYLPKDEWIRLLTTVAANWKDKKADLENKANTVANDTRMMSGMLTSDTTSLRYDIPSFLNNISSFNKDLDFNNGGLKGDIKFPMPCVAEFMLQHSYLKNDRQSMQWVTTTLDAMMTGGLYDHLGGGFARYTTDSLWQVPHFEKMLYDNGQLVSLYAHAYQQTGNESYKKVIAETLSFIEKEMMAVDGSFYSSIDADSEGEEGKYYKWTDAELRAAAGDQALKYFNLNDGVLSIKQHPTDELKEKLLEAREKRVRPNVDRKVITSWNAMMTIGFLDAYRATGNEYYLGIAMKNGIFLQTRMTATDTVFRSMYEGKRSVIGFLDDYAWLAKAYIELYQNTFDVGWLNNARKVTDAALKRFKDDKSPLFYYSANGTTEYFDTVIPSSNSVFAGVLLSLGEYTQDNSYTTAGTKAVEQMIGLIDSSWIFKANWARLAEALNFGPYEIAIVGSNALEFSSQLQRRVLPPALFMGGTEENLPLLERKRVANKTMIYVCKNRTCKLPVDDPQKALAQLK